MRQTFSKPLTDPHSAPAQTEAGTEARPAPRESDAGDVPHESPARRREELARRLLDQQAEDRPQGFGLPARVLILIAAVTACAAFWWSTAGIIGRLAAG